MKKLLVAGLAAVVGALFWSTAPASAHHPEIVIATCPGPEQLQDVIDVTASAFVAPPGWDDDHRVNLDVLVEIFGPDMATQSVRGVFTAPDYAFTARFTVPGAAGQSVTARVTTLAPWGSDSNIVSEDLTREVTTVVPLCTGTTSTTSTTSTIAPTTSTTVAPTSTTVAPTSTIAPTTTVVPDTTVAPQTTVTTAPEVETEVGGISEVRPQVVGGSGDVVAQQGEVASRQLAFSGSESRPVKAVGAVLLLTGAAMAIVARRRGRVD